MFPRNHSRVGDEVSSTNTMACPSCREIVMASASSCRFCGLSIDAESAARANAAQQALNSAIIQANALKYAGPVAILIAVALVLNVLGVLSGLRVLIIWLAPPLGTLGAWLWMQRHGELPTQDADLLQAQSDVRRSERIWGAVLGLELALFGWVVLRSVW